MGKQINNPEAAIELTDQFDLKGRVSISLDETIVPVIIVGDLKAKAGGRRCGREFAQGAGGAGLFSFSGVAAVAGVDLVVEHLFIMNNTGVQARYGVNFYTDAEFTTIGVVRNRLFAFDSPNPDEVASNVWNGLHNASALGSPLAKAVVLPGTVVRIDLGFRLFGDNLTAVGGLGVVLENPVNATHSVSSVCTEYVR